MRGHLQTVRSGVMGTMELVFASYDSARKGAVMKPASHDRERLLDSVGRLG